MSSGFIALLSAGVFHMALGSADSYDLSLRAEGRSRTRASTTGVLSEAEVDPRIGLAWTGERLVLKAAYFPRLMVQEQVGGLQVLHGASANGSCQIDPGWRALASAEGSYGQSDLLATTSASGATGPATGAAGGTSSGSGTPGQPAQPVQPVQPIPRVTTLQYVSGGTSVGIEGTPSPRHRLALRLAAFVEGGGDSSARRLLPLQRGGRLAGALDWMASRADVLASQFTATVSSFENGVADGIAGVTETWHHTLTRDASVRLGIGPVLTAHREAGRDTWSIRPGGEVGVHDRWWGTLEIDLSAQAIPLIDRLTGAAYERADVTAILSWQLAPRWTLAGSASGGIVTEGAQAGDRIAGGEVRVAWAPSPSWDLALGARAISQMQRSISTADVTEATAFLSVTVRSGSRL
jgi:hypothetical protein